MPFLIMGALYGLYLLGEWLVGLITEHWVSLTLVVVGVAVAWAYLAWRDSHQTSERARYRRTRREMNQRLREFMQAINDLARSQS